ncbi:SET domain and MYND-type zinc finger protein 6 [Pseudocercospora fuligena]|uniref:SET domain and MYND-type zinc finger protein 6 n=1 Tax=Pseudocercospora fuligena TaxID=685502 RepID=A0A8H6RGT9_9PEZI|nr:SET domain and MYND-type zinc finger protein 6 [Pseudocercospora fuligena]
MATLMSLSHLRIPGQPDEELTLDENPLKIISEDTFTKETSTSNLTPAIGLATVLYNWCPDSLYAFLDFKTWLSFTWNLKLQHGGPEETQLEVSRIRNQITFGLLDNNGHYKILMTYLISSPSGKWIPDPEETMLGEENVEDPGKIEKMARSFVTDLVLKKRWETGKKMRHDFFVEFEVGDAFEDGIAISPHWLYRALDLSRCTTCGGDGGELKRCGRCGTAAYCSDGCQRKDWAVHKGVCAMDMETRGKALHLSKDGGLAGLAKSRRNDEVVDGEGDEGPDE